MLLSRLHKNAPFAAWLMTRQPPALPGTVRGLMLHYISIMPVRFFSLVTVTAISASMLLALPYVIKLIVDKIVTAPADIDRFDYIWPYFALVLLVLGLRFLFQYGVWSLSYVWRAPMWGRIYFTILAYVQQHQHSFFENDLSGRIIQKSSTLFSNSVAMFNTILWNVVPALFYFTAALTMLGLVSPLLAAFGIIWLLVAFYGGIWVGRGIISTAKIVNEKKARAMGHFADVIGNIRNVIHFSRTQQEIVAQSGKVEDVINADRYWYLHLLNVRVYNQIMIALGIIGLIGGSIYLWVYDRATVGDIALVGTLTILVMQRALDLVENLPDIMDVYGQAQDSLDTLVKPRDIHDAPNAPALTVTQGAIVFDKVNFEYVPGKPVLRDFDLTLRPGERIGLVGTSGAGKTTLVHLLLRLYDIQSGRITIDGQNVAAVSQTSLRENISFIPQDIMLFHRSIRDNIRYGKPDATDAEVEVAARAAQAHDFIMALPHGYDTLVGERGVRLSGGQRQRVAIARALLKNAPILILDEATSALDSEAEIAIQTAIKQAMQGKTVIAIAHRLSTINSLDRLVVLEHGQIIEQGSHAELLAKKEGLYARLWAHQSGGFLGTD